jgi:riboflavin kinase/FMN adenylyltransferase
VFVWRSVDDVPADWGRSVVTIGVFDGVHLGHRELVRRTVERAAAERLAAVVVTFDPHPSVVLRPDQVPSMLSTLAHRLALLEELGVGAVLVLPFTRELSLQSPEDFVQDTLLARLHAQHVVVGEGFRFGHKGAGDVDLLRTRGLSVDAVAPVVDGDERVSSTRVRAAVAAGDVAQAAELLTRPHRVEGPVVRGEARGRELGYPTANVDVARGSAVPADGVYAGWLVRASGERLPAAISVGTNPTFVGAARTVEAYVLDVDLDLYDEDVAIEFAARLRGMEKFAGVDALVRQMHEDVAQTRRILASPGATTRAAAELG